MLHFWLLQTLLYCAMQFLHLKSCSKDLCLCCCCGRGIYENQRCLLYAFHFSMVLHSWDPSFRATSFKRVLARIQPQGSYCSCIHVFLKSAWRHSVYYYYDKARNTPYFASWHSGDSLGVYRWPQCRYKRRFYKSHSRLSKITTGNRCRNIRTMQNVTNRNLIDPNKSGIRG